MPKLVYSLVLWPEGREHQSLLDTTLTQFEILFQVHHMDSRFRGREYNTSNGWRIRSETIPTLSTSSRMIHLYGQRPREIESRQTWSLVICSSIEDAREKMREIHAALADWANNYPGFFDNEIPDEPQTEEVRDSLLFAEDDADQTEDEDVDAPPPVDEFTPNKISI